MLGSCLNSEISIKDYFVDVDKMVRICFKTSRSIEDYKLSRYACYLIAQNADPRKGLSRNRCKVYKNI